MSLTIGELLPGDLFVKAHPTDLVSRILITKIRSQYDTYTTLEYLIIGKDPQSINAALQERTSAAGADVLFGHCTVYREGKIIHVPDINPCGEFPLPGGHAMNYATHTRIVLK